MLTVKERMPETQTKTGRRESDFYAVVKRLPEKMNITFGNASWDDYETLLREVGEASHLRISYNKANLTVLTLSSMHEYYSALVHNLITHLSFREKIKVLCYRSSTMKITRELKGVEPDGCFYVQSADKLPDKLRIDFSRDPMPDIILEIDIFHDSRPKFEIYSSFGVKEIWRYDGQMFEIYALQKGRGYKEIKRSRSLPLMTAKVLTEFLNQSEEKDQYEILLMFEEWLKMQG